MMGVIHHRSFIGVLLVLVIGSSLVLMTLQMICQGDVPRQTWKVCVAFSLFKELQTLIAALLALAAAVVAVRPVYLQLTKMTTQTEIAARDIIERRLNQIISLTDRDMKEVKDIHEELGRELDPDQMQFNQPFNAHIAHELSSRLYCAVNNLNNSQEKKIGTAVIELARYHLINDIKALRDCLSDICAPASAHPVTDEQMSDIEKAASHAESELLGHWTSLNGSLNNFRIKCEAEHYQIRNRIRDIDDRIIAPPN